MDFRRSHAITDCCDRSIIVALGGVLSGALCSMACFVQRSMIWTVRYESCIIESHRRRICCHETRNSATACEVMMMSTKKMYMCVHTRKSRMSLPVLVEKVILIEVTFIVPFRFQIDSVFVSSMGNGF